MLNFLRDLWADWQITRLEKRRTRRQKRLGRIKDDETRELTLAVMNQNIDEAQAHHAKSISNVHRRTG